ncbi:discoidin domain-containing protein [Nocardioides currus]|uniref:NAD glycohydrolase translocation F5/8 type C domain-containing protein n=1 Tax=Nocardioides currus TaxID=2133958 RepID=A0A2R7YW82_9ACTN|nr:discoidin domain-containing protein [Nocardioides currus]PUA80581.1 hypothetical protein C7S10_12525 [Nocardioides currus]
MTTCARCGHELGIGRYCLNCGHPVGEPVAEAEAPAAAPEDAVPAAPTTAARPPAWSLWAVGVVLVLLLLAVLASCLGGDEDEPGSSGTEADTPVQPEQPRRPVDLTSDVRIDAPPAAPPTTDLDGQRVAYGPRRMIDDAPGTAWRTAGDATGQTITFTLPGPSTIRRVGLVNGYAKQVPSSTGVVDWYPNNRRVTAVEWVFDNGTTIRHVLAEVPRLQRLTIEPVTSATVQLRIVEVTSPGAPPLGRDFTAIGDVVIAGNPVA